MLPSPSYSRARFGPFELNLRTRELRNGDRTVLLPEQPFKVLVLLLERGKESATRDEIRDTLWSSDTNVDFEHGINVAVRSLRRFLRDSPDKPKYIETLAKVGYKFLQPVEWLSASAPATIQEKIPESAVSSSDAASTPAPEQPLLPTRAPATSEEKASEFANFSSEAASMLEPADPPPPTSAPAPPSDLPRVGKRTLWTAISVTILLVGGALLAGSFYSSSHAASALGEKDVVVLGDFANRTADPVFDDTLKTALSIALQQSPFLNLLPENKVEATLGLMTLPKTTVLTPEVSGEVCKRADARAYIVGSIVSLGKEYVLTLKAVDCQNDMSLGQQQITAQSKEEVLNSLGQAASKLRAQLGESLATLSKFDVPLAQATTPSLEALEAYSNGKKASTEKGETAALPFYKRAIELDPNFAMGYRNMAVVYANLGEMELAAENSRKAYELRSRVSDLEQFSIDSAYYMYATGELEKAVQVYTLWQSTYPQDATPHVNLGEIFAFLGNWASTIEEQRQALLLEPNDGVNYGNLGYTYTCVNRMDEAKAMYQQAEDRKFEGESLLTNHYYLAFFLNDSPQMARIAAGAMGKPGDEDLMLYAEANTEAWHGKVRNARDLTRRAIDSALRNDAKESAASYEAPAALRDAEMGDPELARSEAEAALKLAANRDVREYSAVALARAGDTEQAEAMAAAFDKTFPLDTLIQRYWLPTIRAAVALQHANPQQAIEFLRAASPIELSVDGPLLPPYLRGQAYLMLQDGNAAAAEFQKFIDYRGVPANYPLGVLARLGLARAYALDAEKDTTLRDKARTAYQNFLNTWNEADPDIPLYQQAKVEYARLK